MEKISSKISTNGFPASTTNLTDKRVLSEIVHSTKRSGGNYGSLPKSQLQPIFYIRHKVEPDDTMQRLALKYSVNIQEIKRINKLWSDAELSLLENVYIPVNSSLLSTLRTLDPTLNVVQNPSPTITRARKTSANGIANDETTSFIRTSESLSSIPSSSTTMNSSSYQDYFSKIDQQIRSSKKSLQTLDGKKQFLTSQSNEISSHSQITNGDNNDDGSLCQTGHTTVWNNRQHKGVHRLSDNSVFVNITTQNQREKHVSAALQRIQQEKDDFDEL